MTTISLFDGVSLFEALGMWATGRYALAPREDYFPPDKTVDEVKEQDAQAFRDSQSAAEIASLRYLGYPNVTYVGEIPDGSPSAGVLEPQDQIVDVDGTAVTDFPSLQAALAGTTPGQVVEVTVLRGGEQVTEKVTLGANADAGTQGFLGIGAVERPTAPFTTSIALEKIGGPSAGLMFTLGIIDKLTDDDLTGGKFIAGTGTIDPDGVGRADRRRAAQADHRSRGRGDRVPHAGRQLRRGRHPDSGRSAAGQGLLARRCDVGAADAQGGWHPAGLLTRSSPRCRRRSAEVSFRR